MHFEIGLSNTHWLLKDRTPVAGCAQTNHPHLVPQRPKAPEHGFSSETAADEMLIRLRERRLREKLAFGEMPATP